MKKCLVTVLMIAMVTVCSCGCGKETIGKGKADEVISNAVGAMKDVMSNAQEKADEIMREKDKFGSNEDSEPDSSTDKGFIDQLNDFVYSMTEQYADGEVTVEDILNGVEGDELMEVINDILTDPTKIPDGDKPSTIVNLDELIEKIQIVADDLIGGLKKAEPR